MSIEMLEKQIMRWKQLLLIYIGVGATLLVEALVELPAQIASGQRYLEVNGFMAVCVVLELACLVPGVSLLVLPAWRKLPLKDRMGTAFGYLAVGWVAFLTLGLRAVLLVPVGYNYLLIGMGAGLIIAYWLLRRGKPKAEEIFP
jgi:hypothetical protein